MITADLIHPQGYGLFLAGILAFDHKHRDSIDQKYHIFTHTVVTIMKRKLFSNFEDIIRWFVVINQNQIEFSVFLMIKKLTPVAYLLK